MAKKIAHRSDGSSHAGAVVLPFPGATRRQGSADRAPDHVEEIAGTSTDWRRTGNGRAQRRFSANLIWGRSTEERLAAALKLLDLHRKIDAIKKRHTIKLDRLDRKISEVEIAFAKNFGAPLNADVIRIVQEDSPDKLRAIVDLVRDTRQKDRARRVRALHAGRKRAAAKLTYQREMLRSEVERLRAKGLSQRAIARHLKIGRKKVRTILGG